MSVFTMEALLLISSGLTLCYSTIILWNSLMKTTDGCGLKFLSTVLQITALFCDIITFPVYLILQNSWKARRLAAMDKAVPIEESPGSITMKSTKKPNHFHVELVRENINTMVKLLEYASDKHGEKNCLGTREILAEEDELQPNGRVFKKFKMGEYKWKSYIEVNTMALHFGRGLREMRNEPLKNIAILAESRTEWMIAAHGVFKQNMPLVTIYVTLGDEAIAHALNETEVTTVITSFSLLSRFDNILKLAPKVETIVYMADQLKSLAGSNITDGYKEKIKILSLDDVINLGAESNIASRPPTPNDTAIIMYTSGSTGVPKGVVLLHKNMTNSIKGFLDSTKMYADSDVVIGYLPLAHVFELLVESGVIFMGIPIGYSSALTMLDSSSKIKKGTAGDVTILKPTFMTSVPEDHLQTRSDGLVTIWSGLDPVSTHWSTVTKCQEYCVDSDGEQMAHKAVCMDLPCTDLIMDRISKSIQDKVSKSSDFKRVLFNFGYEYKLKWTQLGFSTPLIDRIIFGAVKKIMGGQLRLIAAGGAPLTPDTHKLVKTCLCTDIITGYGLTETSSCACNTETYDLTFGRVGAPMTLAYIQLVDWEEGHYFVSDKPHPRGEIIVGGENVSPGYYKKESKDFFEKNGMMWFRTGDIGEIHKDGCLKIIDRKKDLVKLQAGEYVSLGKIESQLATCPLIDNVCALADSTKNSIAALIVPHEENLLELAKSIGVEGKLLKELCLDSGVVRAVLTEIQKHAKKVKLDKFEIPAVVMLVTDQWTPESGLVTASMKLKRKAIEEFYKKEISTMYASL